MVNINWGAAMTAAQGGRLADFFARVLERKTPDEKERIAYQVDGFTKFAEGVFRTFAEGHEHLLGVNEGLATLDIIRDVAKSDLPAEEFLAKVEDCHANTLFFFREGEKIDDPEDNRIATRLCKIVYEFHMEYLKNYLKGETK